MIHKSLLHKYLHSGTKRLLVVGTSCTIRKSGSIKACIKGSHYGRWSRRSKGGYFASNLKLFALQYELIETDNLHDIYIKYSRRRLIIINSFQLSPMYWVSKWVDYSDKYGFGYALCDESIGVVFNDLTKLLLLSDGR